MDVKNPVVPYRRMDTPLQKRLRQRMDELGLNPSQAAQKAGLGESFVRDILRGRTRSPSAANLQKLAFALETTRDNFSDPEHNVLTGPFPVSGLRVEGKIQAGAWLDTSIVDADGELEIIPVARDARFPRAKQYALAVVGDSMNLEFDDGTYVTCVDFFESGLPLKEGYIVHVERRNGPLVEITLKAIEKVDGKVCLVPRSSNPKHKPISLEGDEGTEIAVKGVVIGSFKPRPL